MNDYDDYIRGTHAGFMLGVAVAERLNNLPQNCTFNNDNFAHFVNDVMRGKEIIVESGAEFRSQLPSDVENYEEMRNKHNNMMRQTAMTILLLMNDNYFRR